MRDDVVALYVDPRGPYPNLVREWYDVASDACTCRPLACPYGAPGDRLWVRETFALSVRDPHDHGDRDMKDASQWDPPVYRADGERGEWEHYDSEGKISRIAAPWKPAIHMPRWASRITLEITGVRVERLQDLSEEDARAEGVGLESMPLAYAMAGPTSTRRMFERLWEVINGKRAPWASNPWVWCVSFRRVDESGKGVGRG